MKHKFLKFISVFLLLMSSLTAWSSTNETVYFSPEWCSKNWTSPKIQWSPGDNWYPDDDMISTGETFLGYPVYKYTIENRYGGYNLLQFHQGDDYVIYKTSWFTDNVAGKIYNGSTWYTYSKDKSYTFYFATDWSSAYANCNLGYSVWKDLQMTNTGKTYNGKKIYSITVAAQGFNDIEFHKSNGGDWGTKVVGYSDGTTYKKDFTNALCTSANTWVAYNYDVTLTFNPQNGGANTTKSVLKGGDIIAPAAPSKTGYTFAGWKNGSTTVQAGGTISSVTADATYDAQWTPITYTVAYAGNDNTGGSTANSTHTYDVAKNLTANGFTREYVVTYDYDGATSGNSAENATATYTFKNWTYNSNTYTDKQSVTNLTSTQGATVTMTAQWNPGSVTLPTPTKTGYSFSGWYNVDNKVGDGGASYTPTADITLTAHWTAKQTTITLDGNGATTDGTPTQITATYGQQLPALQGFVAPELTGYNFKGYYSATTDGTQYYNNAGARSYDGTWASEDATATFYAQWENAATYSLTVATSPTTAFTASSGNAENITLGTPYSISATLAAKGYTFTGWTAEPAANASFADKNAQSTTVTVNNGSVTVTANATAKTTTLTLHGNGGLPNEQVITATYDQPCPSFTTPERTGYTYGGFTTEGTSSIVINQNGTFPNSGTYGKSGNLWGYTTKYALDIYAKWTALYWTKDISKNYQDVGAQGGKYKATYDATSIEITTPLAPRVGYTLKGYAISNGGAKVANVDGTLIANVDGWTDSEGKWINTNPGTIYAIWEENLTTLTIAANEPTWGTLNYNARNESWSMTTPVGVDTQSKNIIATAKTGYFFTGWTIPEGDQDKITYTTGGTAGSIVVNGTGIANSTATIQANFIEDLSSNWYLAGTNNIFPNGWDAGETNMMKRATGHSTENVYYFTIHVNDADIKPAGQESTYQFKIRHYKAGDGGCNDYFGWSTGETHFWVNKTCSTGVYTGDGNGNNLYFIPTIAGDYEFKVDATGANPELTVTWPSYNCVYGEFDSWNKDTHKLEFAGGDEASTVVNITDVSKSYQFLVLVNSEYYTNTTTITRSGAADVQFAVKGGSDGNSKFTPDIAGDYTFTYNKSTNKLTITYPALPTALTTSTEKRIFEEGELSFIDSGEGTEANPYKIYTDEALTIDITALAARSEAGIVAKYQFGEEAATTDVLSKTITNPSTTPTSIVVKAFYESDGVAGTAWEKTIYYQGVNKPSLSLTTSWNAHNDEAQEGVDVPENVTVYYSAGNYDGPATVTRSKDGGDPVNFFTVESGDQKSETYALPDKNVQRQTFVATAEVNGRTFTATKSISVYRLVEITIKYAGNLMTNYYMWENGTNPLREEEPWPGNKFFSKLGDAHIFYVKYPSYTHFVLNNGKQAGEEGAIQTVNIELPELSTCYKIGDLIAEGDDKDKYDVQLAVECPNKLYVGDIAPVAALQGEGVLVSPQVDIDPLLDANNLVISFNYKDATGITCDQRGRNFMVTAATTGTKNIQVTYSIEGAEPVTKDVTVNVTSAIMVQVNVPTSIEWTDHNDMWVYYFNHGLSAAHVRMSWKDYVVIDDKGYDRFTARVPLGGDEQVDFLFHEWTLDGEKPWLQTVDVQNVTASGCYTISVEQDDQSRKRKYTRDGDNCWTAYYVEIDMNNGTVYRSNTVEDLSQTVSFFAPGASEDNAKAGLVRIIRNGSQTATIATNTFDKSGIYTAKIAGGGTGLTDVAYYTGDYYIRTDGAEGGWNNYKQNSHKFTQFSLYNGAKYNHYWVANVKKETDSKILNIKACVGNEYNENLANMIESDNYTDGTGNIQVDGNGVNLRFGYNPQTNHFERAILKGAADNHFLNIQGDNIYNDEDCNDQVLNETNYNSHPEYSKFNDVSDWVYEKLIFVQIDNEHQSSSVLLKSKAFNGQILYQLGYTTDNFGRTTSTPAEKVVMGAGSTNGKYTLRVIYDYKTNRLSATWEPSGEINEVKTVDSDILFVSNEGNDVKQITFGNDSAKARLESLQSVMYVLELENNDQDKATTPDAQYWIALPFECKISDIFGIENYITLDENRIAQSGYWGIMRYRGDLRAQKGWFIEDTPDGFWEWMYPTETLMPGEGYVLYVEKKSLSWNSITVEEPCEGTEDGCQDGKRSVSKYVKRFYFPSLVEGFTMNKSTDASSKVTYPKQPCNITSPVDRRAEDSNWKVIAPKSYNNVTINSAEEQDGDHVKGPDFIYEYNEHAEKGSRYTPIATKDFEFKAFHGYMAQYGGTITWNPFSKTEHPTSAPRFAEEPEFKGGMLTIELVQNNEQLDRTFVKLSKNGTEGFDQNLDLTKITESCSQIASVSENVVYAGNTLPLNTELVPLNVKVTAKGTYDIALSESLNGLEVNLYDAFEQTTTPLDMMSATITLDKGEYKDRFYLQLKQKSGETPTSFEGKIEQFNLPTDKTQKLLINDQIYLINAGRVYNATGTMVR